MCFLDFISHLYLHYWEIIVDHVIYLRKYLEIIHNFLENFCRWPLLVTGGLRKFLCVTLGRAVSMSLWLWLDTTDTQIGSVISTCSDLHLPFLYYQGILSENLLKNLPAGYHVVKLGLSQICGISD